MSTTKGVRIHCSGDIDVLGSAKYTAVELTPNDPVFVADITTVSEALQVPLRMCRCPADPAWKDDDVTGRYNNQAAAFLTLRVNPALEDGWAMAPMKWQNRVGSVVVVRADGKDITPQQVETVCYYARYELEDPIQDAAESESMKKRLKVAALFTPGKFREFFAKFKAKKAGEDPSWDAAVCPV